MAAPKKLAILSDIHGDLGSLQDALVHIEREACDAIICAGDYVDYGPAPDETIALLQQCGAMCIRGNHDRWQLEAAAERSRTPPMDEDHVSEASFASLASLPTDKHLSEASFAFLASLPTDLHVTLAGVRVAMWHASPGSDMHKIVPDRVHAKDVQGWLATCAAQVLVVGHSHCAFELRAAEGGMIVNPGTLLRTSTLEACGLVRLHPASPIQGGTFGILELPSCRFSVRNSRDGREVPSGALAQSFAQVERV